MATENQEGFRKALTAALGQYGMEESSDMPDFMIAEYLIAQLDLWDHYHNRLRWVRQNKWIAEPDPKNAHPLEDE